MFFIVLINNFFSEMFNKSFKVLNNMNGFLCFINHLTDDCRFGIM
jgi:hypothetical protein